ncbi:MAG TPA: acetyltransferase [Peptococcaceae bacterium]|nr:acetyltransferase [Peptococcaceae bacterium]
MVGESQVNEKQLVVIGAGGHGKVVAEVAAAAGYEVLGFFDDFVKSSPLQKYPLLGTIAELPRKADQGVLAVVAVGDNRRRRELVAEISGCVRFATVIHPSAVISETAQIGEGTVVMPHVAVNAGAQIGRHAILNTSCSVDHDCFLGDFVHISPGAVLCGGVRLGAGTHIGAGAVVIPGCQIGSWSVVGAGSTVVSDIPDGVVAVGVPARVSRRLE